MVLDYGIQFALSLIPLTDILIEILPEARKHMADLITTQTI